MRTLRLSLVGTIILTLIGGLAGSVVAQGDEDGPAWVKLLAQEDCRMEASPGSFEPGAGLAKTIRDLPLACENTYSDARLSGTGHWLYSEDCFESGICVGWGTMVIDGSDGSWAGWWHEIDDDETDGEDNTSFHIVLTGAGAYEGLTAILFSLGVWEQFPDEYGVIYRGHPPEVITDPLKAVVAKEDALAGSYVIPMLRVVSGTELSPDVLTDLAQLKGRRAVVAIPAGTPITPDLLEPSPAE